MVVRYLMATTVAVCLWLVASPVMAQQKAQPMMATAQIDDNVGSGPSNTLVQATLMAFAANQNVLERVARPLTV